VITNILQSGPPLKVPVLAALIGPDCSGKSTLAKALTNLGVPFVYKGGPTKNVTEGLQKIEERLKSLHEVTNFYGIAEQEFEAHRAERVVLVYCQAPLEVLKQRLQERGDPFITEKDLPLIVDRYQERLATTCLTCISVDTWNASPVEGAIAVDTEIKELIKWSLHL